MSRWWLFPIIAAILPCVVGCDSDPSGPGVDPPSFRVGQKWVYTHDAVLQDSLGAIIDARHDSIEVRVAAIGDTVLGMTGLVRMEAASLLPYFGPGPQPGVESVWYQATSTALVEVAYRNAGAVPIVMLSVGDRMHRFERRSFFDPFRSMSAVATSDSTLRREESRVVLKYPMRKGDEWIAFHVPFLQVRRIESIESIRSLGRDVTAVRVRTTLPNFAPDMEWHDWVSPIGLMRRIITTTALMTEEDPTVLGTMTQTETLELVSM